MDLYDGTLELILIASVVVTLAVLTILRETESYERDRLTEKAYRIISAAAGKRLDELSILTGGTVYPGLSGEKDHPVRVLLAEPSAEELRRIIRQGYESVLRDALTAVSPSFEDVGTKPWLRGRSMSSEEIRKRAEGFLKALTDRVICAVLREDSGYFILTADRLAGKFTPPEEDTEEAWKRAFTGAFDGSLIASWDDPAECAALLFKPLLPWNRADRLVSEMIKYGSHYYSRFFIDSAAWDAAIRAVVNRRTGELEAYADRA